jgi:hypothetical protein
MYEKETFSIILWDYLIWNFLTYKILLYQKNNEKQRELFQLVKDLLENINDKKYKECFRKYWKEKTVTMVIKTKKEMLEDTKIRRKCLVNNMKYLQFDFEKKIKDIQKTKNSKKITFKNPELWGKTTWLLLHMICLDEKCKKKTFLISTVLNSLPCSICRKHAKEYTTENPIKPTHLYLFSFHNDVNKRLQKKKCSCPNKAKNKINQSCKNLISSSKNSSF